MGAGLVVVGASLAGIRAAESARTAGYAEPITLLGAESHLPYDRPPLSKASLAAGPDPEPTTLKTADELAALEISTRLGAPATGLDVAGQRVLLDGGALAYDACVLATGAHARHLPGERLPGVLVLRTVDDATALRRALDSGGQVVVVGAGLIGSEVATAALKRGLPTTVVEAASQPLLRVVGEQVAPTLALLHREAGADLRCGSGVAALQGDGRIESVLLTDGTVLSADLVVVGAGAIPATEWLESSGLQLGDGVVCDETLQAAPGVWAAGDVARWPNPLFGESMRLEHWTCALEQGVHVGRAVADPAARKPFSTVPYAWSELYGHMLQAVGVTGDADEVRVIGSGHKWVALYRRGDRLRGAVCLDMQGRTMKLRRMLAASGSWNDATALVAA